MKSKSTNPLSLWMSGGLKGSWRILRPQRIEHRPNTPFTKITRDGPFQSGSDGRHSHPPGIPQSCLSPNGILLLCILLYLHKSLLDKTKVWEQYKGNYTIKGSKSINAPNHHPFESETHYNLQPSPRGIICGHFQPTVANSSFHFCFYRGLCSYRPFRALKWPFRPWFSLKTVNKRLQGKPDGSGQAEISLSRHLNPTPSVSEWVVGASLMR